jgi:hypothetical protein
VQPAVTIYAWNEYAEGGIVAPTLGEGFAKLQGIAAVFGGRGAGDDASPVPALARLAHTPAPPPPPGPSPAATRSAREGGGGVSRSKSDDDSAEASSAPPAPPAPRLPGGRLLPTTLHIDWELLPAMPVGTEGRLWPRAGLPLRAITIVISTERAQSYIRSQLSLGTFR